MELPLHARTLVLPNDDTIRILAISVASADPEVKPAYPLYDTLKWKDTTEKDYVAAAPGDSNGR